LTGCILKQVKNWQENALFLFKIFTNFLGRGIANSPDPTPYGPYPSAPYSKFLDPPLHFVLAKLKDYYLKVELSKR